ncbi:MAG: GNAT family N-acetyltransferase [bacterium]
MLNDGWITRSVAWDAHECDDARQIRIKVFVDEQHVSFEDEFDTIDRGAFHVLAYDAGGNPGGTGRLYDDADDPASAHIGRMAVMREERGTGCGGAIMQALIDEAQRRDYRRIVLSAQVHAIGFYARFGFHVTSDEYTDVGIPHRDMERILPRAGSGEASC